MTDLFASSRPEDGATKKARAFWCILSALLLQGGLLYYLPTQQMSVYATIAAAGLSLLTAAWGVFAPANRVAGNPRFLLFAVFLASLTSLPFRPKLLVQLLNLAGAGALTPAVVGLMVTGIAVAAWRAGPRQKQILLCVLAAVFLYRSRYAIHWVEPREFDVIYFHNEAYDRILRSGQDPYMPSMPLYLDRETAVKLYPADYVTETSIRVGYVYPPLTLLMGFPSYRLAGDMRYTGVVALLAIAFLLTRWAPNPDGWLLAAILLTNPYSVTVVSLAWIETSLALLACLFLVCWRRWPAQSAWMFGIFISSKQTMVMWVPLGLALAASRWPQWRDRLIWVAKGATAGLVPVIVSCLIWSPRTFYDSTAAFHMITPLRTDSISVGTQLLMHAPGMLWLALLFSLGVPGLILASALRRGLTGSLGQWVCANALAWNAFLFFNRQAFPNYYFLGILMLGAGAALLLGDEPEDRAAYGR